MTKQNEQEALGTAMNKTEMFFEKNSKSMIIALLALFVLAAAIFGYRQLISQPRERKAAEMIAQAQYRFESKAMPTAPASSMSSTSTVPRVRATWPSTMPASATCV